MDRETYGEPVQKETVKAGNFFARLGGVFFSPRAAFVEIGGATRLVIPVIAVFLISAFSGWYLAQNMNTAASMHASLDAAVKQGRITEDQMNQQLAMAAVATGPLLAVTGGVTAIIFCLAIAGYGKLFSMIVDAKNSLKSLFEVSLYAMLAVSVVSTVLMIVILQIRGQGYIEASDIDSVIASSLGSWIESAIGANALPGFVMGLAKAVDILNIWLIALLAIGFNAVSKNLKTSFAAICLSGVYLLFSVISAVIRSAFGAY